MPSGPASRLAGHRTLGSSIITGPPGIESRTCSQIFTDSRISATRTSYRA